jgi:hypothetical protein
MVNLLSVDWDFFCPTSNEPGVSGLYDWGHRDAGQLFLEYLWYPRAAAFKVNNVPLPDTSGEELTFWNRFRFKEGCKLYFADSHVCAYDEQVRDSVFNVVNFDAHHDGGYNTSIRDILKTQRVDCGSWMVAYHLQGCHVQTVYPKWKEWAMKAEPKPAIPKMVRRVDGSKTMPANFMVFDRIFVCRSGGWSPSWLDDKFFKFLADCPIKDQIDIGLTPRTFDQKQYEEHVAQLSDFRKIGEKINGEVPVAATA